MTSLIKINPLLLECNVDSPKALQETILSNQCGDMEQNQSIRKGRILMSGVLLLNKIKNELDMENEEAQNVHLQLQ